MEKKNRIDKKEITADGIAIEDRDTLQKQLNELLKEDNKDDATYQLFMEYYAQVYDKDFQSELNEKINDSKTASQKDQEELAPDLKDAKDLNENEIENQIKEIDDNAGNDKNSNELKKELKQRVYSNYYIAVYDQYEHTLEEALKRQEAKNEFSIDGQQYGIDLVLYEKYLLKLENLSKSKGINLGENEELTEKKKEFEKKIEKMKTDIERKNNKLIDSYQDLFDKRERISNDIQKILLGKRPISKTDTVALVNLRKEYMQVTFEMQTQNPSLDEIKSQIQDRNEVQQFQEEKIGHQEIEGKNMLNDNQDLKRIDGSYVDPSNEIQRRENESKDMTLETITNLRKDLKFAIDSEDYKSANEILKNMSTMLDIEYTEIDIEENGTNKEFEERSDMEKEVKKDSDIRNQIDDSKGDELSIYFNEQLSQVDDKIDELEKSGNMRKDDIRENEIQRTIKRK